MTSPSRLRLALVGERRRVILSLVAGVGVALSSVALSATSAWLIVRSAERPAILSLSVPMGLVQLFALAKAAGRYSERLATHRAALAVMGRLRLDYARRLEPLVPAGLGPDPARAVDTVVGDVEQVQDLLLALGGPLAVSLLAGLAALVVTGVIVPWSALSLGAGLFLVSVVVPLLAARLSRSADLALDEYAETSVSFWSRVALAGEEMALLGASESLVSSLERTETLVDRARQRRARASGWSQGLLVGVSGLSVLATLALSAAALAHHQLSRTLVAVPTFTALAVVELLAGVASSASVVSSQRESLRRLEGLFALTDPTTRSSDRRPPSDGPLSTHQLSVGYSSVLAREVSDLVLDPGEWRVVSGPSGMGKTTLARTLVKFLDPSSGDAQVAGVSYSHLCEEDLRTRVGFVDDSPYVFSTTLAANLRLARPNATDEDLIEVLNLAGLDEWRRTLPQGLATALGGVRDGLSGGERRRLGLARALLRDDQVLVLDEPTEGLDDETARRVLTSLRAKRPRLSLVVISHSALVREFATPWTWREDVAGVDHGDRPD